MTLGEITSLMHIEREKYLEELKWNTRLQEKVITPVHWDSAEEIERRIGEWGSNKRSKVSDFFLCESAWRFSVFLFGVFPLFHKLGILVALLLEFILRFFQFEIGGGIARGVVFAIFLVRFCVLYLIVCTFHLCSVYKFISVIFLAATYSPFFWGVCANRFVRVLRVLNSCNVNAMAEI